MIDKHTHTLLVCINILGYISDPKCLRMSNVAAMNDFAF